MNKKNQQSSRGFESFTDYYIKKNTELVRRGMVRVATETACAAARQNTIVFGYQGPYSFLCLPRCDRLVFKIRNLTILLIIP